MAVSVAVWRIAKETKDYPALDLSGGGAAAFGGRWNSKGRSMVYASSSIALAVLETLAHVGPDIAARNRFLVEISIPIAVWRKRTVAQLTSLPPAWLAEPPGMASTGFGDSWIAGDKSAVLVVPSVIVHEEQNVLINPDHPDAKKLTARLVRQFIYDPRLG